MQKKNTKKKNPRSLAKAQLPSDPERAYIIGHSDGFNDALKNVFNAVVFSLLDLELLNEEEMDAFYEKYERTIDHINTGNLSLQEIKQILKRDYNCRVKLK